MLFQRLVGGNTEYLEYFGVKIKSEDTECLWKPSAVGSFSLNLRLNESVIFSDSVFLFFFP